MSFKGYVTVLLLFRKVCILRACLQNAKYPLDILEMDKEFLKSVKVNEKAVVKVEFIKIKKTHPH